MNLNTPARATGAITERDLDERMRERAAVLEIADQLEREARQQWPARRAAAVARCSGPCRQGRDACRTPQACRQPDADGADDLRPARGIVAALLITALCALVMLALAGCGGGDWDDEDLLRDLPPACQDRPEACR